MKDSSTERAAYQVKALVATPETSRGRSEQVRHARTDVRQPALSTRYHQAMGSNPKDSEWRSTPRMARKRKIAQFTLSDEEHTKLDALAKTRQQPKSVVVGELIMDAPLKKGAR